MSDKQSTPPNNSPFMSVVQAATYLGLKRQTLDNFRWAGGGPRYRKHGGRVLYARAELDRWSGSREFRNTSKRYRPDEDA